MVGHVTLLMKTGSIFQALAQCEHTLTKWGLVREAVDDTAGAAKVVPLPYIFKGQFFVCLVKQNQLFLQFILVFFFFLHNSLGILMAGRFSELTFRCCTLYLVACCNAQIKRYRGSC